MDEIFANEKEKKETQKQDETDEKRNVNI